MVKLIGRYKSTIYGNYRVTGLFYGLIAGVILSLYVLLLWVFGSPMRAAETYATDILLTICVFYMCYRYRERLPEKRVFFKELMLLGLWIGVVAAIVYGLWLWLYGSVIDTEFVDRCIEGRLSVMDLEDESFETHEAIRLTKAYTAGDWGFIGGFRTAVMSILMAFMAAIVFKTEKNVRR